MTDGDTTAILLYSPEGDAVQLWRQQLGHWDINNRRDPSTQRGAFGVDNYNNLAHGSDAVTSVQRDLSIISERVAL
jgi:nucleoside diphosphate kinase